MHETNPIRRRYRGQWTSPFDGSLPRPVREWLAICPTCSVEIVPKFSCPGFARPTRKTAKDALYRHGQEEHKPGLVGAL